MSSFTICSVQLLEPNVMPPETVNSDWPAGVWLMSQYAVTVCAESRRPNGDRVWTPDVVTPCSRRASHCGGGGGGGGGVGGGDCGGGEGGGGLGGGIGGGEGGGGGDDGG